MQVKNIIKLLLENYKGNDEIIFLHWAKKEFSSTSEEPITDKAWAEVVKRFADEKSIPDQEINELIQNIVWEVENSGYPAITPIGKYKVMQPADWDWGNE